MRNGSFHECRVCEECSQQFYGCGAAEERARIVALLRELERGYDSAMEGADEHEFLRAEGAAGAIRDAISAIERGEHISPPDISQQRGLPTSQGTHPDGTRWARWDGGEGPLDSFKVDGSKEG